MTTETQQNNGHKKMPRQSDISGVIHIAQPGQLANEFISPSKSFSEAAAKCFIRDDQLKNDITIYKAQLDLFPETMTDEVILLTDNMTMSGSVGGFNRSISAMVGTGIYVPEGAGIRMNKENQKAIMELQKERAMSGRLQNEQDQQKQ